MWRIVLVWTVALGATMIVVTAMFDYFVSGSRPVLENMKIRVPIFLISAFVGGIAVWFVSERMFRKGAEGAEGPKRTNNVHRL